MKRSENILHKTTLAGAFLTASVLAAYFLLMRLIGLAEIVELRFVNYIILIVGMYLTIRYFKSHINYGMYYLEGIGIGFYFMFATAAFFGGFFLLYLNLDAQFLEFLSTQTIFGKRFTPVMAVFYIMNEIIGAGVISILIVMQVLKRMSRKTTLEEVEAHK